MGKIKQIKLNTNGTPSLQSYKIGADVEDIDYKISNESTKSVREILGEFQTDDASIKEELDDNKQHISNLAEQFLNIEQDFSTIQKKFEEAEPKLDTLIDLDNIVSEKVTNKVNSKKFSTDDIIWTDGIPVNLHKILGNLRNLPYNSVSLRDWIEKISTGQGQGSGDANYENLDYVPLSNYGDISQGANITQVLKTALASGYNIFIDLKSCQIEPGNYTLLPGKMLKGSPTVVSIMVDETVLTNDNYFQMTYYDITNEESQIFQRPALVNFLTKGGVLKDITFTQTSFVEKLEMPEHGLLNSPDVFLNQCMLLGSEGSYESQYRGIGNIISQPSSNSNEIISELGDFYNLIPPGLLDATIEGTFESSDFGAQINFPQMVFNMRSFDSSFVSEIMTLKSFYASKPLMNFINTQNSEKDYNFIIENCIFEGGNINCNNSGSQVSFINCSFINHQTLNNNLQITGADCYIDKCNFINGYYGISLLNAINVNIQKCNMINTERLFYSNMSQNMTISNIQWYSDRVLFFRIVNNSQKIQIKNIINYSSEETTNLKIRGTLDLPSPEWASQQTLMQLIEKSQSISLQNIQWKQSSYALGIICNNIIGLQIKKCNIPFRLILESITQGKIEDNTINSIWCLNSIFCEIQNNILYGEAVPINNTIQSSMSSDPIIEMIGLTAYENTVYESSFDLDILIFNNYSAGLSRIYNNILSNNQRIFGSSSCSPSIIGMFSANIFPYFSGYLFTNYRESSPLMYSNQIISLIAPNGSNQATGITYLKEYKGEGLVLCPTIMLDAIESSYYSQSDKFLYYDNRPETNIMFKTPTLSINLTSFDQTTDEPGDSNLLKTMAMSSNSSYSINSSGEIISLYRIVPISLLYNTSYNSYSQMLEDIINEDWNQSLQLFRYIDFHQSYYNICKLYSDSSNSSGSSDPRDTHVK